MGHHPLADAGIDRRLNLSCLGVSVVRDQPVPDEG